MATAGEWGRVAALSCIAFASSCGAEENGAAPAGSAKSASTLSPLAEPAPSAQPLATGDGQGKAAGDNDAPKLESGSPQAIPSWGGGPGGQGGGSRPTMLAAVAFDLEGKLTAEDVRKTIDESRDKFSRCLNGDSTVSVKAKVMPSGALSDVSVPSSVPNDAKLRDCVVEVLKTITFPKPKGVEPAGLRLDLALKKQLSF